MSFTLKNNNGWFVIASDIPAGATKNAITWIITPNIVSDWLHTPVIQASQVGYHTLQPKIAVIELDKRDEKREKVTLYEVLENGEKLIYQATAEYWGEFLRYNYLRFDFSDITKEGLYRIRYGASESSIFRIAPDVYDRWVFTEDNPPREFRTAAHLAAVSRVLKGFNDELSKQSLDAAMELFEITEVRDGPVSKETLWYISPVHTKIHAAVELYLTTGKQEYKEYILSNTDVITEAMAGLGWIVARVDKALESAEFSKAIRGALGTLKDELETLSAETPYGIRNRRRLHKFHVPCISCTADYSKRKPHLAIDRNCPNLGQ